MEETIDLKEIFSLIWSKIWLIAMVAIAAILVSGIISIFALDKVYESYSTIMISKSLDESTNNLQYNDILLNQKLVKTYSEIVRSDRILVKVLDDLDMNETASYLRKKIHVESVSDTEIIKISVEDNNPYLATEIANSVANIFMNEIEDIMKMDNVQLIDPAKTPTSPIKPRVKLNIAIAAVLGVMLSVLVIFMIEFLDNTIKTPQDIEKSIGLPYLGSVPVFEEE